MDVDDQNLKMETLQYSVMRLFTHLRIFAFNDPVHLAGISYFIDKYLVGVSYFIDKYLFGITYFIDKYLAGISYFIDKYLNGRFCFEDHAPHAQMGLHGGILRPLPPTG